MVTKLEITRKILEHLEPDQRPSVEWAMKNWWMNFRDKGGLRLNTEGYTMFMSLNLETWQFEIPPATPGILMILDQKLTCPYFLKLGKKHMIVMFGSKEATLFGLYGDMKKFVKMLNLD